VSGIPEPARLVLQRGVLCYLAVRTPLGPHLTPVVYTLDGGRLWVTTSRGSVKARAWRPDPFAAGLVVDGSASVTFRGRVRTYDAFDPLSWTGAMLAGPRLVEAGTRFTLKNARFFAGYAVDVRRVPLAWTPLGRLFASINPGRGRLLATEEAAGTVAWGDWPEGSRYASAFEPLPRRRALDLKVPKHVRSAIGSAGTGALAVEGDEGLTVLPVRWRRRAREGAYEAILPAARLDLAAAGPRARVALTVDHASRWRAAAMAGLMLQGTATLHSPRATRRGRSELRDRVGGSNDGALVRLVPERIVWWKGWTSGAVVAT
jgi:hypothetical protein